MRLAGSLSSHSPCTRGRPASWSASAPPAAAVPEAADTPGLDLFTPQPWWPGAVPPAGAHPKRACLALNVVLEVARLEERPRQQVARGKQVGQEFQQGGQLVQALGRRILAQALRRAGAVLVAAGSSGQGGWAPCGWYRRDGSGLCWAGLAGLKRLQAAHSMVADQAPAGGGKAVGPSWE